eukprot:TRINITY_DN5761_c0_g1_i9.p1 TRINITY_DN5761_c0_g1~~TRINITY_DN5761_c0_g1_i9.p1  ORF type:complete len:230 (+),score=43.17 TRINITY_DN5761_c0_g1_i9:80-691(+)
MEKLISAGPFAIQEQVVNGAKIKCYVNQVKTMPEFYLQQFPIFKDKTWIVFEKERYTYGDVAQAAAALAHELAKTYSVKAGDRVALTMRNYPEWCIAFIAVTAMGAVCVPLNGWWSGPELEYGLSDSGSKVLICDGERYDRALPYLAKLGVKTIITRTNKPIPSNVASFDAIVKAGRDHATLPKIGRAVQQECRDRSRMPSSA